MGVEYGRLKTFAQRAQYGRGAVVVISKVGDPSPVQNSPKITRSQGFGGHVHGTGAVAEFTQDGGGGSRYACICRRGGLGL